MCGEFCPSYCDSCVCVGLAQWRSVLAAGGQLLRAVFAELNAFSQFVISPSWLRVDCSIGVGSFSDVATGKGG